MRYILKPHTYFAKNLCQENLLLLIRVLRSVDTNFLDLRTTKELAEHIIDTRQPTAYPVPVPPESLDLFAAALCGVGLDLVKDPAHTSYVFTVTFSSDHLEDIQHQQTAMKDSWRSIGCPIISRIQHVERK